MWNDVHSESWPMTPTESRYGYMPTYLQSSVIAQPYGVPIGGMAGRRPGSLSPRERRRLRKMRRRARRAETHGEREARRASKRQGRPVPRFNSTGVERGNAYLMEGMAGVMTLEQMTELSQLQMKKEDQGFLSTGELKRLRDLSAIHGSTGVKAPASTGPSTSTRSQSSNATPAAPAGSAVPVWRAEGAEVVPQGRDPETYFRSLGYNRGDARTLAEHARAYPGQRGERRRLMDRLGAPMERRNDRRASGGGGGGGVDIGGLARGVGDLFGGLFGRREQAQTFDFGGGDAPAAAPAASGMSPILIAGLAAAGLGAAFLLTQD